jgi:multiple sugar transport system permease protein
MLDADSGAYNALLRGTGLGALSHDWLTDPATSLLGVVFANVWVGVPFNMVLLMAGLQGIDPVLYEAAAVDGAGAWQRFRHITLPLIRPAVVVVVILRMMTALSAFAAIFAATGGGPGSATEILNLYAYRTSFSELNLGYGAALAVVLLAITLAISWLMFRLRRARR